MVKHKVLLRQLKRYQLCENECPISLEQWQKFLDRINIAYVELDQDRYLSQRAQEISWREMQSLNDALQEAQSIAHLGSWILDWKTKKVQLSKEAYHIFDLDISKPVQNYQTLMQFIHPDDGARLEKLIEKAVNEGQKYEAEIRIEVNNNLRWVYIIGEPSNKKEGQFQKIIGTILDITENKEREEREIKLNKELVIAAKQIGMAEVAISVLHNIGNVLNSVNVSALLVTEKLQTTKLSNLRKIANLYLENSDNIIEFLTSNPKGKQLLNYIVKLADYWDQEKNDLLQELASLDKNVDYIKTIVLMQQSISGSSGLVELNSIAGVLEDAIQIYIDDFKKGNVTIIREYDANEEILIDKSKLHQILVNLIHNAKDSLLDPSVQNNAHDREQAEKKMILRILDNQNYLILQVIDNGVGISPENIIKIFSFGFSTKKTGHGFGLHSSALAANEMGGTLTAKSDGLNKGAIFSLKLPKNYIEHKPTVRR